MKNLSRLSDKEKARVLARRAYAKQRRMKNPEKVEKNQRDFFLRYAENQNIELPEDEEKALVLARRAYAKQRRMKNPEKVSQKSTPETNSDA